MITQLTKSAEIDREFLRGSHTGRKILSCFLGYGTDYDFCRFFRVEGQPLWLMLQNSTLLLCAPEDFPEDAGIIEELSLFAEMHKPFRIEGSGRLLSSLRLPSYQPLDRYVFALTAGEISPQFDESSVNLSPSLDEVYDILSEGFPHLIRYDLWLTDTSHMVRRGLRRCYTYDNMTTASAIYDLDDQVLIGQVATRVAGRGKGYARDFLHYLANEAEKNGKTAILYALEIRRSYYEEIGFRLLEQTMVWELRHAAGEEERKGLL